MADLNTTQPSFSSGIVSTELFSRIDFSKLASGLKQCENFKIRPAGGASYRTGTKYISETHSQDKPVSLIPFVLDRDNGYCLEFGENYIRVYKNSEFIHSVSSSYLASEVSEIKYAQYRDTMYLVHKNHAPAMLVCKGDTDWTLTDMVFNTTVPSVTEVTLKAEAAKKTDTVVKYSDWQYAVSVVDEDDNEGMAVKSGKIESDIDLLNQNITVTIKTPSLKSGYSLNVYRIYRGNFYFVYRIEYEEGKTEYTFKDISFQTDTTKSIRERFTAFDNGNYPSAVGMWNQRLIFGNTPKGPATLYGSHVGRFDDFTSTVLNNADEAFELELASGTTDYISDLCPMDDLIVMTNSKIWRVVGNSASTMAAYIESYNGSSGIRPYQYKKSVLFVDSSMNTISNFIYSYELNGFVGQNLDLLCRELLDGHEVVDITFADAPYGILYVVRDDGVLLCLTYLKEENIYAWHIHTTQGKFLRVCSVDRSMNDDVYCVIERGGKRYIEKFMPDISVTQGAEDGWYLDCATESNSEVQQWRNIGTVPVEKTYYGYESEKQNHKHWYCWKCQYRYKKSKNVGGHKVYITLLETIYLYSETDVFDVNKMYYSGNYETTTNAKTLVLLTTDRIKNEIESYERISIYDFDEYISTDVLTIYATDSDSGVDIYDKDLHYIETIDGVLSDKITYKGFVYNHTEDKTTSEDVVLVSDLYTFGEFDFAYSDVNKNDPIQIESHTEDAIVVGGKTYELFDGSVAYIDTVSGLDRFEGCEISVMADGNEHTGLFVENGKVSIDRPCKRLLAGLPYTGIVEPIPVDTKFKDGGSSVGLNRRIKNASIRYNRTRGLWYGTNIDKLYEVKPYTQETFGEDIPLESGVMNVSVPDTFKTELSFLIVQKSPLPALLQSVTLEIDYGEKN